MSRGQAQPTCRYRRTGIAQRVHLAVVERCATSVGRRSVRRQRAVKLYSSELTRVAVFELDDDPTLGTSRQLHDTTSA